MTGRGGARHFQLGGPLEGPVLQQGEMLMVCVGLSERDLKNLGVTGRARQNFGGAVAPSGTPLAPPLMVGDTARQGLPVLPLCCYGKVLYFMIKKH